MSLRILAAVVLLALLIFSAGCNKSKSEPAANNPAGPASTGTSNTAAATPDQTVVVSTADRFLDMHKEWTRQLESITQRVNSLFNDWAGGKITEEQFLEKLVEIRNEMRVLNKKTDLLTEFKLSEGDKQKVGYDAIYKGYLYASKSVSDFLEMAPSLTAEQIKAKYGELVKDKYQKEIDKLKAALKM